MIFRPEFTKMLNAAPTASHWWKRLAKRIYLSFTNRVLTEPTIFLNKNPRYAQWKIGDYTYSSKYGSPKIVHYGEPVQLCIGKFCSIAEGVTFFLGGNHRTDWVTTFPFTVLLADNKGITGHPVSKGDITIGHDVWIGEGASIMNGVTVGNGAVIAAKSVVVHDVPDYGIVAGNPARLIRHRFDEQTAAALIRIGWWNWNTERIIQMLPLLLQPNIQAFIDAVNKQHA
jgi:acetyltransferase-like isoleucine patch superfamily enzyme